MLSAEQWSEVERLYARGAGMAPDQRADFLERECPDESLRSEVASLLEYAGERLATGGAIAAMADSLVNGSAEPVEQDSLIGSWLGPYRITGFLARGGMGAVYEAVREDDQFRKRVAIKVIPRVLAGPGAVARFRSERQILANLEHPNIARLLDGGTSDGIPYLVMEYVEGVPITDYVRANMLPVADCLRLMLSVCAAVTYAHQNLVIHRDLKPANILVTGGGVVKLLDFGIAKLTDPSQSDATLTAHVMMTPDYASPEQIQGAPVTTASDVYSLGVVLYEVLTGERPYRAASASLRDLEQAVCKTEARRPSALGSLPARTRRRLAGDLDNIVLKALQKEPARRYGSVEQLAEDIRRHLDGMPVQARADTWLYRGGKFIGRHRTAAAAAFLVAASLVIGTVIAAFEARSARQRFDQLREFARTMLVDMHGQLADVPGAAKARQALVGYVDDYLKRVAAQHAGDDAALAAEFATTYLRLGETQGSTPEALASFEKGQRLLEQKRAHRSFGPADQLVLARLDMRSGVALVDLGRTPAGVENLTAAIRLADAVSRTIGWNSDAESVKAFAEMTLGRVFRVQYRLPEAERHARTAIAEGEEILRRGYGTKEAYEVLTIARNLLAGTLRRQGHWKEGLETYQKVLADAESRAGADPGSASLQRQLGRSHAIMADMVVRAPDHDEKELLLHVRRSIAIAERLAAADPYDKSAQTELAQALSSGAEALQEPAEWNEAMGYLGRALPILENLLKSEPDNGTLLLYTALTEADLGTFLGQRNSHQEALHWLRRGLSDLNKLMARDRAVTLHLLEYIKVEHWLAEELARAGQAAEALAIANDAIEKSRRVVGDPSSPPETWLEVPLSYESLADVCRTLGKREEARRWYRVSLSEFDKIRAKGMDFPDSYSEIEKARKGAGISPAPAAPARLPNRERQRPVSN